MHTPTATLPDATKGPPPSAHVPWNTVLGLIGFTCVVLLTREAGLPKHVFTMLCILGTALPMFLADILVFKVHKRPSAGLIWGDAPRPGFSASRVATKLVGLAATIGGLGAAYWLLPEWSGGKHSTFFLALQWALPGLIPAGLAYIVFIDARMANPKDGLYLAGAWVLQKISWEEMNAEERHELKHHILGWVIKGFYLPLMFGMYAGSALGLANAKYSTLLNDGPAFAAVMLKGTLAVDLAFGALGYCGTFRLLDAHIRSANPFPGGWAVTVVMYSPFWGGIQKFFFAYGNREDWHTVLPENPTLLWVWALGIVGARMVWAWANSLYGFRFSNLTHRGIITAGPYRWTRHPSYVFKNLSWWLSGVPFIVTSDVATAIRETVGLFLVNCMYWARAKYEERHLSEDPTYVAYAMWVEQNSPLRFIKPIFPFLRYKPPTNA